MLCPICLACGMVTPLDIFAAREAYDCAAHGPQITSHQLAALLDVGSAA